MLLEMEPVGLSIDLLAVPVSWLKPAAWPNEPHYQALALGGPPDGATDQSLFVTTFSEQYNSYEDGLRSNDRGTSCALVRIPSI